MNMFAGMQTQPPQFNTGNAPQQQQQQPAFSNGGFGGFQSAPQSNSNGNYYGGLVNLAPSQGGNSSGKL